MAEVAPVGCACQRTESKTFLRDIVEAVIIVILIEVIVVQLLSSRFFVLHLSLLHIVYAVLYNIVK